ncbi:MAG: signal peptidase I [Nocardioidaceae bacterium]
MTPVSGDDVGGQAADVPGAGPDDPSAPAHSASGPSNGERHTSAPAAQDTKTSGSGGAPKRSTPLSVVREVLILIGTAVLLALIIKTFFVQAFFIPSGSMENTLKVNDRILVEKVSYWFGDVHRGDIVVFDDPDHWLGAEGGSSPTNPVTQVLADIGLYPTGGHLVKRVIGVAGDHVKCVNGIVNVNGVPLHESSYVTLEKNACTGSWSVVVPPDKLWVLGDNRAHSADSSAHLGDPGGGFVPVSDVVGKVFVIVWPIDRWRWFTTPSIFDNPALNNVAGAAVSPVSAGFALALSPVAYRRIRRRGRR